MSEQLTQDEINALIANENSSDDYLSQEIKDIIGEVGNISMSQAATTLSQLLNRKVQITTPRVENTTIRHIIDNSKAPKIVTMIDFKAGLVGKNVLMIDVADAVIIADLMMGNDGLDVENKPFTDLEMSAVSEAMNQMIGSASTAMATMFDRAVDISPPDVKKWDDHKEVPIDLPNPDEVVCTTSFNLSVEGLLDSEIMQVLPLNTVEEIAELMVGDEADVIHGREGMGVHKTPSDTSRSDITSSKDGGKVSESITIQKPKYQSLTPSGSKQPPRNLDLIMDVPLDFSVVLGKSRKTIKDVLALSTGSVVELDKMTDEPLEIYVNGKLIAEGEVVVINESFGIRITNILSKEQRVQHLNRD